MPWIRPIHNLRRQWNFCNQWIARKVFEMDFEILKRVLECEAKTVQGIFENYFEDAIYNFAQMQQKQQKSSTFHTRVVCKKVEMTTKLRTKKLTLFLESIMFKGTITPCWRGVLFAWFSTCIFFSLSLSHKISTVLFEVFFAFFRYSCTGPGSNFSFKPPQCGVHTLFIPVQKNY